MLHRMNVSEIVKAIDERIAVLQQAKALLSTTAVPAAEKHAKDAVAAMKPAKTVAKGAGGRKPMSEEGRARIAVAQKKRWALKHAGTPAKKSVAKKAVPAKKGAAKKAASAEAGPSAETTES